MRKFLERLYKVYPDSDRFALERIVSELQHKTFPQLNDQTEIVPTQYPTIKVIEMPIPHNWMTLPDEDKSYIRRKPGMMNRLRRVWGEIINTSVIECGGYNIIPRKPPVFEKKLEIKMYGFSNPPYNTMLACAYYPEKDQLFVWKCETASF